MIYCYFKENKSLQPCQQIFWGFPISLKGQIWYLLALGARDSVAFKLAMFQLQVASCKRKMALLAFRRVPDNNNTLQDSGNMIAK